MDFFPSSLATWVQNIILILTYRFLIFISLFIFGGKKSVNLKHIAETDQLKSFILSLERGNVSLFSGYMLHYVHQRAADCVCLSFGAGQLFL